MANKPRAADCFANALYDMPMNVQMWNSKVIEPSVEKLQVPDEQSAPESSDKKKGKRKEGWKDMEESVFGPALQQQPQGLSQCGQVEEAGLLGDACG
ncbi:hypothetical protein Baya_11626 [Bagarius yarrelli]|uniref:Uncharacterized protein n=1 Tax=Bagarius yarrelli TaxID=175774 RepID=A0A556V2F4_BAGYA|nr:hypothetical protein Baya_11626 [Bagarius yarrelli]